MTREDILNGLISRGYNAELKTTHKNGEELEGILVHTSTNISPMVYTQAAIEAAEYFGKSLETVLDEIESKILTHNPVNIDVDKLFTKENLIQHTYIGFQKYENTEDIIKRNSSFEGIEEYLYMLIPNFPEGEGTVKITSEILTQADIDENTLWNAGEANTKEDVSIVNIRELFPPFFQESIEPTFYVISNSRFTRGASAVINKEYIKGFASQLGVSQFIAIPSSINEMLLVPIVEGTDIDMNAIDEMVQEVNYTSVLPEERLTDKAYLINVA